MDKHNQNRHETDKIEGRNPVIEAIKSGREINKILVAKGAREGSIRQIIAMAKDNRIVVQQVDIQKLNSISLTRSHQGVIAFTSAIKYVEVEDILENAISKSEDAFVIVLDEIADPQNLGSIIRSADAAGAHGVIIPKRRAVGITPVVAKASAGAVEYVPIARVSNIAQTLEKLKKTGIWIVGTDAGADDSLLDCDLKGPIAVLVGGEGKGLGTLIKDKCDRLIKIPMKGRISSLNAAVAAAVIMYEVVKQRRM